MMYMLKVKERERAISAAMELVKDAQQDERMSLVVKALANYIEKSSLGNRDFLKEVDGLLVRHDPRSALQQVLMHMVMVGTSDEPAVRKYTTGEVARFFGVSIQTIHNWIVQGRFKGVPERARDNQQYRIPETAVYVSPSGKPITVNEAAELYAQEQVRLECDKPITPEEELAELLKDLAFYESKYGGAYEDTLGKRANLSPEEERDAALWASLIRMIERRQK